MKEYYTVGEMAKLNYISPHTLRYYDKINLLKPSYINQETGYRYYSYKDFLFLDAIQYLKVFNMPLEEIKEQFETRTVEKTLELYEKQLVKIREDIAALKNIETRILHNIDNLSSSKDKTYSTKIEIVDIEERYTVILSDTVSNDEEYEVAIRKLSHSLYENNFQHMGDFVGLKDREDLYKGEFNITKNIGNMCLGKPDNSRFKIIPAGKYIRRCYVGPTEEIKAAYHEILQYINDKQLTIVGDIIEIYTVDCIDTKEQNEYVTVIEVAIQQ